MKITKRQLRRIIKEEKANLNEFLGFGGPNKQGVEDLDQKHLPEFGKGVANLVRNIAAGDYDRKDGSDMLQRWIDDVAQPALDRLTKYPEVKDIIDKGKKPGKKLQKFGENLQGMIDAMEGAVSDLKRRPGDAAGKTKEAFGWVEEYFPGGLTKDAKIVKAKELFEGKMKITRRQLRRIIKEEKARFNEGRMKEMEMQLMDEIVELLEERGAIRRDADDPYDEALYYIQNAVIPALESFVDDQAGRNPGGSIG